ncbi:hypothetical protein RsS62_52220 [Rhizobium dioscoreae]|nr:hypothetical protein RsS62_52220 [Rhizobium dioscoreae]
MLFEKAGKFVGENQAREEGIDVDAQPAANLLRRTCGIQGSFLYAVEMRPHALPESAPLICQPQGPRGSIKQAYTDPGFQALY